MCSSYNLLVFSHSILKCLLSPLEMKASCCHTVFLQILFDCSKLPKNVSVHSAWLSSAWLQCCFQFLTLTKKKKRDWCFDQEKSIEELHGKGTLSSYSSRHPLLVFRECVYIYVSVCICVCINFPRYMQKERRSLVVMCKVLLCVLTARLANNDLYAPACIKYVLLVHAC